MPCSPSAHHTFFVIVLRMPLLLCFPEHNWYPTTGHLVKSTLPSLDLPGTLSFH